MTQGRRRALPGRDLVPGQLRGFRQFELRDDGLYPLVHTEFGAWDGQLERASCGGAEGHAAPAADCRCGLYGWYLPGSATVALGRANAVVAVHGRCILGDRGFRAAAAHIDAVVLPAAVRWNPRAARRARTMLAARYPGTVVYDSTRRMLKHYPPDDVSAPRHPPAPGPQPRLPDGNGGAVAHARAADVRLVRAAPRRRRSHRLALVADGPPARRRLAGRHGVAAREALSLQSGNPPGRAHQQP